MQLSPERYRAITVGALVALMVIVVTGAAVRLTGSGLGCDDWPRCSDERLIDVSSNHAAIEQINRLFTGLVALAVIAAVLGSLWRVPRRRDLTLLSLGLVAGVVGQIVLGGITVLVDLHPAAVQGHLLLSMVLVGTAVVLVHRAGEPDEGTRTTVVTGASSTMVRALATATGVAIVTGTVVTGAGPHAGDEEARRFDVSISAVARVHGVTVMIALAVAATLAIWLRAPTGRPPPAGNPAVLVGVRRAAPGGDRLHPVLQRRAAAARRPPRRRGHGAVGDDRLAACSTPRRSGPRSQHWTTALTPGLVPSRSR